EYIFKHNDLFFGVRYAATKVCNFYYLFLPLLVVVPVYFRSCSYCSASKPMVTILLFFSITGRFIRLLCMAMSLTASFLFSCISFRSSSNPLQVLPFLLTKASQPTCRHQESSCCWLIPSVL